MTLVAVVVKPDRVLLATDSRGVLAGETVHLAKWVRIGRTVLTVRGTYSALILLHRRLAGASFDEIVQAAPAALQDVARELRYGPGHDFIIAGFTEQGAASAWRLGCDGEGGGLFARSVTRLVLPWAEAWGPPRINARDAGVPEIAADVRTAVRRMRDAGEDKLGGRMMLAQITRDRIDAFQTVDLDAEAVPV